MGYDTQFTESNKKVLSSCGLLNKTLVKKSKEERVSIEWTQAKRNIFGNKENYYECYYEIQGEPGTTVMVFVAESCGSPPSSFSTSGYSQGGGVLHFGFVFMEDENGSAIFFVIHPNSWGPYQKRFRTSSITKFVNTAIATGAGRAASVATGALIGSIFPGVGTAVGAAVGGAAAFLTPSYVGDYLRYIGG